jgi:hypothetical protein
LNSEATKKFHFQEIDKIIHFPCQGNKGKYLNYLVQIKTPQTQKLSTPNIPLSEFLESAEIEKNYPHTVGYYKQAQDGNEGFQPEYLEIRRIYSVEEFWIFLNAQNL